jgi:hypothetical protein
MSLKITDPANWRGRSQLQGRTVDGNVIYTGPRVGRWTWDSSKSSLLATLEQDVYTAPLKAHDAVRDKRSQLKNGGRLTPAGVNDEIQKFAAIAKPTIDRAKESLAKVSREVADRRAKIKPVASGGQEDPNRVARKIEARSVIRSMSRLELVNILAGKNPDPIFVEAVLESDPRIVNIGPALRKQLETAAVQSRFGAEIEELDELERAIETAGRALKTAEEGIGREIKGSDDPVEPSAPLFFRSA